MYLHMCKNAVVLLCNLRVETKASPLYKLRSVGLSESDMEAVNLESYHRELFCANVYSFKHECVINS